MSAKIKIETEDSVLAGALVLVVAEALKKADFAKVKVKMVLTEIPDGEVAADVLLRKTPVLLDLKQVLPAEDLGVNEITAGFERRNPGLKHRPIVIDGFPDEDDIYKQSEKDFLKKD